jgi:hypothetical protein
VAACLVIAAAAAPAHAEEKLACARDPSLRWAWDPCPSDSPEAAELHLPLPGGKLFLVFRSVEVPGSNFWCDLGRNVQLGQNDSSDPFAGVQTVQVGGAFPLPPGREPGWRYWIGKYDFSTGQAAAILGNGDLRDGVRRLVAMLQTDPGGVQLARPVIDDLSRLPAAEDATYFTRLGEPTRGLTAAEIADLLERLNIACYKDAACGAVLRQRASLAGIPGFVRLPTETEWEYAARGGAAARAAGTFGSDKYWKNEDEHSRYVVSKSYAKWPGSGAQRIGGERLPGPGGLFDTLGNVRQLTSDLFSAEMGQGRSGALAARGGSRNSDVRQLTFGLREEVPMFRWDLPPGTAGDAAPNPTYRGVNRDILLGFRPVLVSVNVPTVAFYNQVRAERSAACRSTTPAATSTSSGTAAASDLVARVIDDLRKVSPNPAGGGDLNAKLQETSRALMAAQTDLRKTQDRLCAKALAEVFNTGRAVAADLFERNRQKRVRDMHSYLFETTGSGKDQDAVAEAERQMHRYQRSADLRMEVYVNEVRDAATFDPSCVAEGARDLQRYVNDVEAPAYERALLDLSGHHVDRVRTGLGFSREQVAVDFDAVAEHM